MRFGADLNAGHVVRRDRSTSSRSRPIRPASSPRASTSSRTGPPASTFEPRGDRQGARRGAWRSGGSAAARNAHVRQAAPGLLAGSRYAERLPIGDKQILETFPHDALTRFYATGTAPTSMAVMAVGDFDADSVDAMIRTALRAPFRPGAMPRPRIDSGGADDATRPWSRWRPTPRRPRARVTVAWRLAEKDPAPSATYRAMLVSDLHDLMLNQRLDELTRRRTRRSSAPEPGGAASSAGRSSRRSASRCRMAASTAGSSRRAPKRSGSRRHGFTSTELIAPRRSSSGPTSGVRRAGEDAVLVAHRRIRLAFPGTGSRAGDREGIRARAGLAAGRDAGGSQRGGPEASGSRGPRSPGQRAGEGGSAGAGWGGAAGDSRSAPEEGHRGVRGRAGQRARWCPTRPRPEKSWEKAERGARHDRMDPVQRRPGAAQADRLQGRRGVAVGHGARAAPRWRRIRTG